MDIQTNLLYKKMFLREDTYTYAIVDANRDKALNEILENSTLHYVNLWNSEILKHTTKKQSIYLVLLSHESNENFLDYLFLHKDIVTYFFSSHTIDALKYYYRHFTYPIVELEPNKYKKSLLGFYDPKVLNDYLETLYNEEKINEFFAGIKMWIIPHLEKDDIFIIAFKNSESLIETKHINNLDTHLNIEQFEEVIKTNLGEHSHEVTIDYKQVEILNNIAKKKFIDEVFVELKDDIYRFEYPEKKNKKLAFKLFDEAKSFGINRKKGIYLYIVLGLLTLKPISETSFIGTLLLLSEEEAKQNAIDLEIWKTMQEKGV